MSQEMQAVTKIYDVLKWLMPQISKLPRSHKFTLGDRVTNLGLDVLTLLVEASYTRDKLDLLRQAKPQAGINALRFKSPNMRYRITDTSIRFYQVGTQSDESRQSILDLTLMPPNIYAITSI